jgi:hypothetical protein
MIADRWDELPGSTARDYYRDSGAVYSKLGTGASVVPLRPVLLTVEAFTEFAEASLALREAVRDYVGARWSTIGDLASALDTPPSALSLVDPDAAVPPEAYDVMRPDMVVANGVPKILEMNIDGSVGGTRHVDVLNEEFARVARSRGMVMRSPIRNVDARFGLIRSHLDREGRSGSSVVLPFFTKGITPGINTWESFRAWTDAMNAQASKYGLEASAFPLADLTCGVDGDLYAGERRITAVLRLFSATDQPHSPGLQALARCARASRVHVHTSEAGLLLSNKRLLAWLWDLVRNTPDHPHADTVRRYVPETYDLAPRSPHLADLLASARTRQAEWVLKPGAGYGGQGVVLGSDVSTDRWSAVLEDGVALGGAVLQHKIVDDGLSMAFRDETGEIVTRHVSAVFGPFVFGTERGGILVRHASLPGGGVINAQRGACINTALVVGE